MRDEMYDIIHEMIKARYDYWYKRDNKIACAFADVLDILEYGFYDDIEALVNFDFFPIDKVKNTVYNRIIEIEGD